MANSTESSSDRDQQISRSRAQGRHGNQPNRGRGHPGFDHSNSDYAEHRDNGGRYAESRDYLGDPHGGAARSDGVTVASADLLGNGQQVSQAESSNIRSGQLEAMSNPDQGSTHYHDHQNASSEADMMTNVALGTPHLSTNVPINQPIQRLQFHTARPRIPQVGYNDEIDLAQGFSPISDISNHTGGFQPPHRNSPQTGHAGDGAENLIRHYEQRWRSPGDQQHSTASTAATNLSWQPSGMRTDSSQASALQAQPQSQLRSHYDRIRQHAAEQQIQSGSTHRGQSTGRPANSRGRGILHNSQPGIDRQNPGSGIRYEPPRPNSPSSGLTTYNGRQPFHLNAPYEDQRSTSRSAQLQYGPSMNAQGLTGAHGFGMSQTLPNYRDPRTFIGRLNAAAAPRGPQPSNLQHGDYVIQNPPHTQQSQPIPQQPYGQAPVRAHGNLNQNFNHFGDGSRQRPFNNPDTGPIDLTESPPKRKNNGQGPKRNDRPPHLPQSYARPPPIPQDLIYDPASPATPSHSTRPLDNPSDRSPAPRDTSPSVQQSRYLSSDLAKIQGIREDFQRRWQPQVPKFLRSKFTDETNRDREYKRLRDGIQRHIYNAGDAINTTGKDGEDVRAVRQSLYDELSPLLDDLDARAKQEDAIVRDKRKRSKEKETVGSAAIGGSNASRGERKQPTARPPPISAHLLVSGPTTNDPPQPERKRSLPQPQRVEQLSQQGGKHSQTRRKSRDAGSNRSPNVQPDQSQSQPDTSQSTAKPRPTRRVRLPTFPSDPSNDYDVYVPVLLNDKALPYKQGGMTAPEWSTYRIDKDFDAPRHLKTDPPPFETYKKNDGQGVTDYSDPRDFFTQTVAEEDIVWHALGPTRDQYGTMTGRRLYKDKLGQRLSMGYNAAWDGMKQLVRDWIFETQEKNIDDNGDFQVPNTTSDWYFRNWELAYDFDEKLFKLNRWYGLIEDWIYAPNLQVRVSFVVVILANALQNLEEYIDVVPVDADGNVVQQPDAYACDRCKIHNLVCHGHREDPDRMCFPCQIACGKTMVDGQSAVDSNWQSHQCCTKAADYTGDRIDWTGEATGQANDQAQSEFWTGVQAGRDANANGVDDPALLAIENAVDPKGKKRAVDDQEDEAAVPRKRVRIDLTETSP